MTTGSEGTERGEGGGFEMQVVSVDPSTLPGGGQAGPDAVAGEARREIDDKVSQAMVRAACAGLNSMIVGITGYREMELTEEEVTQLDELWAPLLPKMSPLIAAIFGTVIIAGGKVALYAQLRKGGKRGPTDTRSDIRRELAGSGGEATEAAAAAG